MPFGFQVVMFAVIFPLASSQYAFKFRCQMCGTIQKKIHIHLRMINFGID